jgi:hypothetical protein
MCRLNACWANPEAGSETAENKQMRANQTSVKRNDGKRKAFLTDIDPCDDLILSVLNIMMRPPFD